MYFQRCFQILFVFSTIFICYKFVKIYSNTKTVVESDDVDQNTVFLVANKTEIFENWRICANFKLMGINDPVEFWEQFSNLTKQCDEEAQVSKLGLIAVENKDEQKIAILPKNQDENHTFITLGIGRDTTGEERFQKKMEKLGKTVKFYGADPMVEVNSELYSKVGTYFPFAVARHPGFTKASVLKNGAYTDQIVAHVDILYFLKEILEIQKIDHLWMDAEGAEYELFEIFNKNEILDQNDIEVCQVNMEIHISEVEGSMNPNFEKQKIFMDFIKKIIMEKRYGVFRNAEVFHMRIYFFNFESEYCRNKY